MELDTPPLQYSLVAGEKQPRAPTVALPSLQQRRAGPGGDSRGRLLRMPQSVEGMQGVGQRQEQSSRVSDYEIYNTRTHKHDIHGKRSHNGGEGRVFIPKTVLSFQITIATPRHNLVS